MRKKNLLPDIELEYLGPAGNSGIGDVDSGTLHITGFFAAVIGVRVDTAAPGNFLSAFESEDAGATFHELDADYSTSADGQYALIEIKPSPNARWVKVRLVRGVATGHGEFLAIKHTPRVSSLTNGFIAANPIRKST